MAAQSFQPYQWKNRLIVIVSLGEDKTQLNEQLAILEKDNEGLKDRKLLVYQFSDSENKSEFKKGLHKKSNWQKGQLPLYIKNRMTKNTPFQVFLLGLDGGIKLQKNQPVSLPNFFNLIDQMPMRQSELRRKKSN